VITRVLLIALTIVAMSASNSQNAAMAIQSNYPPELRASEEAYFGRVRDAVETDNKEWLANQISYPIKLYVNNKRVVISDKYTFLKCYEEIFNKRVKEAIVAQDKTKLLRDSHGTGVGRGELWFDLRSPIIAREPSATGPRYYIWPIKSR
jgi:hypothetical protein